MPNSNNIREMSCEDLVDDGIIGIGSGGSYAIAAARALIKHTSLNAKELVEESLNIAADICVYTNKNIKVEEIK